MKPIYPIFSLILLFSSCIEQIKPTQKISVEDSLISTLIARWGGSGDSLPVWEIRKDSIYDFQRSKAYSYRIVDQDMIISRPESQGKLGNIHVISDTLFFLLHPGVEAHAIRFK